MSEQAILQNSFRAKMIAPMYDSRSAIEVAAMAAGSPRSGYDIVKESWPAVNWNEVLARGVIAGTTATPRVVAAARIVP